ncbi:MAG: hypothetical protein JWM54_750 [Acidobacteriaceae bacterium]|jgi:hypothetical protein|nr:hypothetical protein [Acidobacteriaceae bacterium]
MGGLGNIMIGYFFGFALGVGCALAVMYTIWAGGYRRAVEHSLMVDPPERFRMMREAAVRKQAKQSRG